jgi:FtsP/CotA-like multicopper oxidase with cupredoxin domain
MLTVNGDGVAWLDNNRKTTERLTVPRVTMAPGEVVRLRILNGTNSLILPLVAPGLEIYQIGVDGVNFLKPALLHQKGTTLVTRSNLHDGSTIVMAPANRSEILVRAPMSAGTYTLSAAATSGVSFEPFPLLDLVELVVGGDPVAMKIPASLPAPVREYPLIDGADVKEYRKFELSEFLDLRILTGIGFYVNGNLYDMTSSSVRPKLGTAEEWTITNSVIEAHPLHVHVNSFQVIEINGKPVDPVLVCDTILVPPGDLFGAPGSVKLRMRFKEFSGKTVFHCHITAHEDTGMMQNVLIEG